MRASKFIPAIPLLILLSTNELVVRLNIVPPYLLPSPTQVFQVFWTDSADLWLATWNTAVAAFWGFLGSAVLGIFFGVLFSSSRWVERAFYPYAVFFQTVPIIAIAPLLVIWFGYGRPTVIASTLIVSIFPMIASTLSGMRSTELPLVDLFRLYKASRFQELMKLRLPFAIPQIFVGLRISSGLAVIGAIVGEFIAGGGIGGIIDVARARQRVDQVFAAILLASLIGLLFIAVINFLSKLSLRRWHASEKYEKKQR